MLGEAKANKERIESCDTRTSALRERFEGDFGKFRNEKFEISKEEGEWDSFTTNRPSTDAHKIINTLASAHLKLWIPITDEDKKQRQRLSKTEKFPYGVIALRDSIYQTIPEALPLKESLAWFAVVRGWVAVLCYLYKDGEKIIPHIPVWDIFNTYWISGTGGLLWAAYKRYASKEDVKDQYKEDLAPDKEGRIELYDVWDTDQLGVIHGEEWLKAPEDHNCGHVPILILPVGSTPYIQSKLYTDTIKNVGESWAVHNRHLYETESRMGSYLLTMAGEAAHAPLELHFDSTKAGKPIELGVQRRKGATVNLDDGKGQSIKTIVTPEMTRDAFAFFDFLQGRESIGGQTPVAYGQINQALPAAGISLLRHASMENIKPPQKAVERVYAWLAQELVSQYKSGGFGKMEIQGLDGSNRRFKMEVKPGDIDNGWNFEAELTPDFPQDEMANMGMAVQAVESELLSRQSSRDKYHLVDDTDLEQERIDTEKAYKIAGITLRRVAAALKEDGDEEGAQFILDELELMKAEKGVPSAPKTAAQPGIPAPVRPSGTTTAATPAPPPPGGKPSGLRKFLSRFGVPQ